MIDAASVRCDGVRARAALAPDGELSLLERRLLEAHLARCEPCREFAERVAQVVVELRAAAAVRPAVRVAPPARPRRRSRARARAAVAAVAVAATALGTAARGPLPVRTGEEPPVAAAADEQQALRRYRRDALVASAAVREHAATGFGVRSA